MPSQAFPQTKDPTLSSKRHSFADNTFRKGKLAIKSIALWTDKFVKIKQIAIKIILKMY
jgi:hypothetical protein